MPEATILQLIIHVYVRGAIRLMLPFMIKTANIKAKFICGQNPRLTVTGDGESYK